MTRRIASSHVLLIVVLAACSSPGPETSFRSDDPSARTRALARAVQTDDYGAIPDIIVLLDSSDPALRMLAIQALEDLTGETLGYDHAGPEDERREAADAWAEWWLTTGRTRAGGQKTAPADAEGVGT